MTLHPWVVAMAATLALGASCSTSPTVDHSGDAAAVTTAASPTVPERSSPSPSPTTTCPPYQPSVDGLTPCPDYDAGHDDELIDAMLDGDALAVAAKARPTRARVLAVGDSILAEAQGYLVPMAAGHGLELTVRAVGGTAPCDWIGELDALLDAAEPDVVLLSFSGNAFTPCMEDRPPGSPGYYRAYRQAAAALNRLVAASGSEVWWMEVPPFGDQVSEEHRAPLHDLYLETPHTAGLIPTRTLFESETGEFATELGCWFPWEQCPAVRLRADDGVHLDNPRSPYGALRYAVSIIAFAECWADDRRSEVAT